MNTLKKIFEVIVGIYNILSFIFAMLFTLVLIIVCIGSVGDILKK